MRSSIIRPLLRRHKLRHPHLYTTPTQPIPNHASYSTSQSSPPPPFDPETYLHQARQKLTSHPPTLIPDTLSPTPSHLLTLSLADHAPALFPPNQLQTPHPASSTSLAQPPSSSPPSPSHPDGEQTEDPLTLPQGHHLVYFPLQLPPSQLMPDGTDPGHCPGYPFVRRMWAGGEVRFNSGWRERLLMDGRRVVCMESVGAPVMKGTGGKKQGGEKVFVDVERRYGVAGEGEKGGLVGSGGDDGVVVKEVRRLVFMREREAGSGREMGKERVVRASATPEFSYSLTPDATLLFHFSALTYNAHAIHIDPDYARNREGYKGLLVHGPLTLVLMLSALRACLPQLQAKGQVPKTARPWIRSLSYRNLAPLYVNEEMRVCLRRTKSEGEDLGWDVWIEGPEGGLAVKGRAITTGVQAS